MGPRSQVISITLVVIGLVTGLAVDTSGTGLPEEMNLEDSYLWIVGESGGDRSGTSVDIAGDVNGDGYDDILIGAYSHYGVAYRSGKAYLVFGSSSGLTDRIDLEDADASFVGESREDLAGRSVAGAGDVNGDGYDDILIGSYENDEGGLEAGQVYLVFGRASGWSKDVNLSQANASFHGEANGSYAGWSVAGAGDVNADGYDDFLIGAHRSGERRMSLSGKTYLILGRASGWSMDTDLSQANASFIGESGWDESGRSVAGAGDVNRDGYSDVLIGAPEYETKGKTYLILGKSSGWATNTSLSSADASWYGEGINGALGSSVAGAGDVNGDGYDDIITGDPENDGVSNHSGAAFLILGRASGWPVNASVANANASFNGENADDFAGRAVAGAGDIDGDGYDDMLIGAMVDYPMADSAGKTYLLYGKASGWSMDVNLSTADASFRGKSYGDYSGSALSGGGDVNGDGCTDLLVGAPGVWSNTGITYLISDDVSAPSIFVDATPRTATTGDVLTFNVTARDDIYVSNVSIEYWFDGSPDRTNASAVLRSGHHGNGSWHHNISIPHNSTTPVHYMVHVFDWIGHYVRSPTKHVRVIDDDPPELSNDTTPMNGTTGDTLTFKVDAVDNINLTDVRVEYWTGQGDRTNLSMMRCDDVSWNLTIQLPPDSLEPLSYILWAVDNSSNSMSTETRNVTVIDDDRPRLIEDLTATYAYTGDPFEFVVNASDNIGVVRVTVEFWYEGGQHNEMTMVQDVDGRWRFATYASEEPGVSLHYVFHMWDAASNLATTTPSDVAILDNDAPFFERDMTPSTATTGDPLTLSIAIKDNSRVTRAHVEYWFGDEARTNVSLTLGLDDVWSHTIRVPSDSVDPLHYLFVAVDDGSRWGRTPERAVNVSDNDAPTIVDLTPSNGTTGDELGFSFHVADNIGVIAVWLEYWQESHDPKRIDTEQDGEGRWTHAITVGSSSLEAWHYSVTAIDGSNNRNETPPRVVDVRDNDPPEVVEDLSDTVATTGDPFTARIRVVDNIGVASVSSGTGWTAADVDADGNGVYVAAIPVAANHVGRIRTVVIVLDQAGNEGEYELVSPEVLDDDPPVIGYEHIRDEFPRGGTLPLNVNATDNIDVEGLFFIYRYGDGEEVNETTGPWVVLEVPRLPGGDLHLRFSAVDGAGNWRTTGEYVTRLVNSPPRIVELPVWNVTEGSDAVMPLEPYLGDHNGDPLDVRCSDPDVTVDQVNKLLQLRHDAWVPDRTVTLTVSDGEEEATADLTIHVVNVNDAPVITELLPENGTKVKDGGNVVLSLTYEDEDGDEATVTWTEGTRTLGTGSPLEVRLKPGRHVITAVVDDGTDQSSRDVTVTVTAEEEGAPWLLVLLVVVVVLAAALGVIAWLKRR